MKILVNVFSNLVTDQRVEKVCETLLENGYEIELIGCNWKGSPELERPYPFSRISLVSKSLKLAYPEFNKKLYHLLLKKADENTILLANDLDSLLPNYLISKKFKIPLIFDSHEIFTEMPALQNRFTQKIWRLLENKIVPKLNYIMTANESYANWFEKKYKIPKPIVVNNFPKKRNVQQNISSNSEKTILYQGAINPSRGLDKLITAMPLVENATLWIAGNGPKLEEYKSLTKTLGLENRIHFLGIISPKDLQKITESADVGLSIEENNGESYYLSLPNKIADYIQARIPLVVSNFPEMRKMVLKYGVGEIIKNHSSEELAAKISTVLKKGKIHFQNNLDIAAEEICWENEAPKLLQLFRQAKEDFLKTNK